MHKIKNLLALAMMAAVILGTGCSHTKQIGRIGDLEVYKISIRGLDSPNITALATRNVQDNRVEFLETASGAGLGPALVGAAGGAGAAALNGVSLRPSTTRVNNTSSGGYGAGGVATGGGASNVATGGSGGYSTATGGAGGSGQGYGSAGATSSAGAQSGSYSQSDSWSGVIGSANNSQCVHGSNCGVCKR
jgi:hypothetical protein